MKKCGYCGFDNDDNARHCSDCGSSLDEIGDVIPTPTQESQMGGKLLRFSRPIAHVMAVLAILSFCRAVFIYGSDGVGFFKSFFLVFFLFGWFVVRPVSSFLWKLMPPSKLQQFMVAWISFNSKYVFLPIMIVAFVWMTFTTWKRAEGEEGLKELLHFLSHPAILNVFEQT
jgi:hypothetical protein